MRRREFIALVGSAAAAWPLAARAGKLPTIGVLGSDAPGWSSWTAVFVQRLHELGWIEGRTIAIEYRWSDACQFGSNFELNKVLEARFSMTVDVQRFLKQTH